jgi:hypothetical protein
VARRLAFCSTGAQFESEVDACSLDLTPLIHKEKLTLEELAPPCEVFGLGVVDGKITMISDAWCAQA